MAKRVGWGLAGWLVAGIASGALAAPPAGATSPSDVLKGPSAEPRTPPTSPGVFGDPGEARPGKPASNSRAKYDLFQRALAGLMKDEAPASLRLTAEQADQVRAIQHEFRQANEAFFREHQDEIRRIRERTGDKGPARPPERRAERPAEDQGGAPKGSTPPASTEGPDRPGGADRPQNKQGPAQGRPADAMSPDEREEMMRRLRALEEQRPDPGPFQARVWESLREDQRAHLMKEMEREGEEIAKRRGEERLKKEREERATSPDKAPGKPGGRSGPGEVNAPQKAPGAKNPNGAKPGEGGRAGGAANAERIAQRLQVSPKQAEEIVSRLKAAPSAEEKGLSAEQRIERRVNAIPESVLPASKRGALKQMLASHAKERGGERGSPGKAPPKKDRKGDEARPPSVDEVNVPRP